jgi:hypothetical protein
MAREAELFVQSALWGEGRLETLFTANIGFVTPKLASFYRVPPPPSGAGPRQMQLPGRAGVLTLPAMMAALAHPNESNPVRRGNFIRTRFLCQAMPPPPQDVPDVPPQSAGTWRERLVAHTVGTCAGCHRDVDSLGLAFEIFDGIGRYRSKDEGGRVIDASGTLMGVQPQGAPYKDALELVRLLARAPETASCFIERAFSYANGRAPVGIDSCAIDRVRRRFETSGGNLLDLIVAMVTDDSFLRRRVEAL